jgi:hypothetical protein
MVEGFCVKLVLCLTTASSLLFISPVLADNHGSVRVYKLNSKGQLVKKGWVKHDDEPGCHDLRRQHKVHRFAQVGFSWCTLYAGDKCKPGTELSAMWKGGKYRKADIDISLPQTRLLPGSKWYLDPLQETEVGSWACEY